MNKRTKVGDEVIPCWDGLDWARLKACLSPETYTVAKVFPRYVVLEGCAVSCMKWINLRML